MFTRVVELNNGCYQGQYSTDGGKTWEDIVHRPMFVKKLCERHTKGTYPKAKHIGTVQESSL